MLELLEGMIAHRKAIQSRIMADDRLPVSGVADIKLEPIGAVLQGKIKSGKSVLGRVLPCAAMAE